ncbi:glycosyltransferase family 1 protein [Arthrobacter sp. EH-1B-1]|uniref:D-inositol 3-phosphate glycosyltransferase n=1 Tax=Arthrobacter vasquezii TaxID=2977629 RepID=A0ABT6CW63_9MICC|nr:glycosyltransferase family 1 protein [Arthrobacter vasquezii]MDF9278135.1 glycosyltransferase family 1 protein [Arthrobacter vasquezii]
MRVAVVAESFLPHMNGVTHSLLKVLAHLRSRGDDVLVIAPSSSWLDRHSRAVSEAPASVEGYPVITLPSVPLTGYTNVRLAAGTVSRVRRILAAFAPDVVHVASPFVLGWRAVQAAEQLGLPTVSVYQTEIPAYAARYGVPWAENLLWQRVENIHQASTLTLAPSSFALKQLDSRGIPRLRLWRRGVDTARFNPVKRDGGWRHSVAPAGTKIIGYVGRLAAEKQVEDLAGLDAIPETKLVIVGSGPAKESLQHKLPGAHFAGFQSGEDLARMMASFDLFVHPGESETFCQTIQEAMASGVPVVAVGRGGPLDLVDSSRTGWLYPPGELDQLHAGVMDLLGDDTKRRAFGRAAYSAVQGRTWPVLCEQLTSYYMEAIEVHRSAPVNTLS